MSCTAVSAKLTMPIRLPAPISPVGCPPVDSAMIDANEIFYPELQCENPVIIRLRCLLENCSEQEATALIPVIEAVLEALRSEQYIQIK